MRLLVNLLSNQWHVSTCESSNIMMCLRVNILSNQSHCLLNSTSKKWISFYLIHGWSADFDTFREMNISKFSTWVNKLYKKIIFILFQNLISTFSGAEWPYIGIVMFCFKITLLGINEVKIKKKISKHICKHNLHILFFTTIHMPFVFNIYLGRLCDKNKIAIEYTKDFKTFF